MLFRILAAMLLLFGPGMAFAQDAIKSDEQAKAEAEDRYAHLEKGKSGFKETWVSPEADFTKFSNLFIWNAEFQYRDVGPARRTRMTMMNTRQREFGISEKDRKYFEELVSDAFIKEIQKAKNFELVKEIGPGTLIMRAAILDIVSLVPPDAIGRSEIYLSTIGEATLVLELIDASNGNVIAVVAERQRIGTPGSGFAGIGMNPTNNASIAANIKRWSSRAAAKLGRELDKAIAGR